MSYEKPVTEDELRERAEKLGNVRRVSLAQLEEHILSEHYLNPEELHPLTICVLKLRNGFMVTGESAPAMVENFDEVIGRRLAREHAVRKVWMLLGYGLREKLYQESQQAL